MGETCLGCVQLATEDTLYLWPLFSSAQHLQWWCRCSASQLLGLFNLVMFQRRLLFFLLALVCSFTTVKVNIWSERKINSDKPELPSLYLFSTVSFLTHSRISEDATLFRTKYPFSPKMLGGCMLASVTFQIISLNQFLTVSCACSSPTGTKTLLNTNPICLLPLAVPSMSNVIYLDL